MAASEEEARLKELIERSERKEKSVLRKTVLYTLLPIAFAGALLLVVWFIVSQKQTQLVALNEELRRGASELAEKREKVEALDRLLQDYGWLPGKLGGNLDPELVGRSVLANDELLQLAATGDPCRRGAIEVRYFPKIVDPTLNVVVNRQKVDNALKALGFKPSMRPPILGDTPTNLIRYGPGVDLNDVKLVAYVFMRAGVRIKGIYRFTQGDSAKIDTSSLIIVAGNNVPQVLNGKSWTVEQVRDAQSFEVYPF
jgi:hypothetical protein